MLCAQTHELLVMFTWAIFIHLQV